MRGLNKAQIIGHTGSDPDLRYTSNGTAVANLSVATNAPMQDDPEWHNVTCWGDLAEIVNEHVGKGERLYVEGQMRTEQWEDPDGRTRRTFKIHADEVIFLGDGARSTGDRQKEPAGDGQSGGEADFVPDDELPF